MTGLESSWHVWTQTEEGAMDALSDHQINYQEAKVRCDPPISTAPMPISAVRVPDRASSTSNNQGSSSAAQEEGCPRWAQV